VRQQAYSLHASMSSAAGDLSLLVRQYGDCTALTIGALTEAETRALVRKVFFGEDQWEDVQADASGCITSLTVEAEHSLFRHLSENQAFKELFGSVVAQPLISAHTVAAYVSRTLSESDPAQAFIDAFAEVTVRLLHDLFDGSLIVELPAVPDEPVTSASTELMVRAHQERPSTRRRPAGGRSTVAADVPQLSLDRLLTEYCDFRQSQAPSLSERDKDYLRLLFLWGKDLRSISRASDITYQRVQQVVACATERLQEDLLAHESYRVFWARLHRLCIVTPGILASVVTEVLGDQGGLIDATAIGSFLFHVLKLDQALKWYKIGRARLRCCRGTQPQLASIVGYVREVRSHRRQPVSDRDVSAVCMFILSHSELPSTSVRTVATDLLAVVYPPDIADQLEAALVRRGMPSHFTDLARCLDDTACGDETSADYVHAVLCRDHRFAWAGLGTYALTAWGYPRETSTLDVVLHMIRTKGSGVTLGEVFEFMFTDRHYELRQSSVRQALKMAEGRQLRRVGADIWDELEDVQEDSEVIGHE
jgi:hypothetical protein